MHPWPVGQLASLVQLVGTLGSVPSITPSQLSSCPLQISAIGPIEPTLGRAIDALHGAALAVADGATAHAADVDCIVVDSPSQLSSLLLHRS